MTISDLQRQRTEDRIRAAIDRLLRGQIPPGGGCDVKTLAREAGVSRASLYRTYQHLKRSSSSGWPACAMSARSQIPALRRSSGSPTRTPDSAKGWPSATSASPS